MSKEEKLLNEWQERLGLEDWAIALVLDCNFEDFEEPTQAAAESSWRTSIKAATIRVAKPELCANRILKFDFEMTLVHELMHIKFALIEQNGDSYENSVLDSVIHQYVDDIARALVMAKRGETKRKLDCKRVIR